MKNEFIPYEQALALKELGFDEACICYYDIEDSYRLKPTPMKEEINAFHFNSIPTMIAAPLFQQVFRWFREKYDLYISITHYENGYSINDLRRFDTYEEAEFECLKKLIVNTNEK